MQEAGERILEAAGYHRDEVSAWSRGHRESRHNLNYWEFGDFIGIGAGAHGKLTRSDQRVERRRRRRHPVAYMDAGPGDRIKAVTRLQDEDLVLEFMMNVLRLAAGVPAGMFEARTGLKLSAIRPRLRFAVERGLLEADPAMLKATDLGWRHLNALLTQFA